MTRLPSPLPRLAQDSGFARVLRGNAFDGPFRRRRRRLFGRRPGALGRTWRALLAWLAQPSPWRRTP